MDLTDFYDVYTIVFTTVLLMLVSVVPMNLGFMLIVFLISGDFMFKFSGKFKGY
ncbi:MAG: hypothetical protein H7Z71_05245 [Moraxellaceae bacterium]|nr:hypothetical protein [Pseudobdellovibrionaceae bacterium]